MKEIGGYIELDTYWLPMLHEKAIALNCGRNALAYLFKSRSIKRLKLPYLICDSIIEVCRREGVAVSFYHIDSGFKPASNIAMEDGEWLYLINYYSQFDNKDIAGYVRKYKNVIVDNANSYFQEPLEDVDTIYTCRKYFGVADGAFLYTNSRIKEKLSIDESFDRMRFLLGRYERTASEFYEEYDKNNKQFADEPVKRMSKLTMNLLHGIDYKEAKKERILNFEYLSERLGRFNILNPSTGTFMYPFMVENGAAIRKKLIAEKIYIPTLWPAVFDITRPDDLEYKMAQNILPLPIDQRYKTDDMEYMAERVLYSLGR